MNILCNLDLGIHWLAQAYVLVLLIYAVISWIPDLRGPWVRYLAMLVEPLLNPLRRVIPPIGGIDIAFLVLLLIVQLVVIRLIDTAAINACAATY